jgi:hypothetical protein
MVGLHQMGQVGLTILDRTLILIVIAEMLVCWMMADFVYPEMKRLRETGGLRDLALTQCSIADLRRSFLSAGLLLSLPITGVFVADVAVEWFQWHSGNRPRIIDPPVYHPIMITALAFGLPATALMTTSLCVKSCLHTHRMADGPLWALTLLHLGGRLAMLALLVAIPTLVYLETSHPLPLLDVAVHLLVMMGLAAGLSLGIARMPPGWLLLVLNALLLIPAVWLLVFVLQRFPNITAPWREMPRLPFALGLLGVVLPLKILFWWLAHRQPLPGWTEVVEEER